MEDEAKSLPRNPQQSGPDSKRKTFALLLKDILYARVPWLKPAIEFTRNGAAEINKVGRWFLLICLLLAAIIGAVLYATVASWFKHTNVQPLQNYQVSSNRFDKSPVLFGGAGNEFDYSTKVYGETNSPKFELYVNGSNIVSGATILLNRSRAISLKAKNVGEVTAERTVLDFYARIAPTNVLADKWQLEGPYVVYQGNRSIDVPGVSHWRITSGSPVGTGQGFLATPLVISTNFPFPAFQIQVDVFSEKSKVQPFILVMAF